LYSHGNVGGIIGIGEDMATHASTYEEGTDPIVDQIVNNLRQIYDPEIHINIYDLGLIYDIDITEDLNLSVTMTLTSAFCPVGDMLYEQVNEACNVGSLNNVNVEMTFDPTWGPEMIPEHAKLEMGLL